MTCDQYHSDALTDAQRTALRALYDQWRESPHVTTWEQFRENASVPTYLCPYVGIWLGGMFVGIEHDGYTHT